MSITIRYRCGHEGQLSDTIPGSPVCHCGETQITYVRPQRMPRFTGSCTGPYATFTRLDPGVVDVAPAGPLRLKEQT